ncbi:MAG: ATP-binding protein [Candidatus Diapherotrites archaeon]|nr:ATP-binding protein [Candidatus Diapherotrites archaeon]
MELGLWKVVEQWNYWKEKPETGIPRDVTAEAMEFFKGSEALYFFGPRRAGKTFVCMQLLSKLSKKHGKKSCLYVNFEEPALAGNLRTEFIEEIVVEFKKVHGKWPRFVFLDEVQNVKGWERWVRGAVDRKRFKVFVTGSSAKLLSSEFSTSLGGRGIGFLVLPFSFSEFRRAKPKAGLKEYLEIGGYPAVVLEKNERKRRRMLEEYFDTAIMRDIVARHDVRDVPTLRTLAVYLLTNSGKRFSYNKLRAMTHLSFDALRQYLSYLEDALVVFQVPYFSYSMKKALEKPRKYYAYDLGLQGAVSKSFSPDWGRKAENAVAIELVRRRKEIQYYSNKFEVDFIIKEGTKIKPVNVCYSEKPPQRETKSLEEFSKKHKSEPPLLLCGKDNILKWLKTNQ